MSSVSGITFSLGADAAIQAERRQSTGYSATNMQNWMIMTYGSADGLINSVNQAAGGNYVNDNMYVQSNDEPGVFLYGSNDSTDALEVDWTNGTGTLTNTKEIAEEAGIGTGDNSTNFNYALWGKDSLQFVANQDAEGIAPGSTTYDLSQDAFSSRWGNTYYTVNNVDFSQISTSGNPTSEAGVFATNIFNQYAYTMGQWISNIDYDTLSKTESTTEYTNALINLMKAHSFTMPTS